MLIKTCYTCKSGAAGNRNRYTLSPKTAKVTGGMLSRPTWNNWEARRSKPRWDPLCLFRMLKEVPGRQDGEIIISQEVSSEINWADGDTKNRVVLPSDHWVALQRFFSSAKWHHY